MAGGHESSGDDTRPGARPLVVRCAWCGRVRTASEWAEVEAAGLRPGSGWGVPTLSHGICPACFDRLVPGGDYPG